MSQPKKVVVVVFVVFVFLVDIVVSFVVVVFRNLTLKFSQNWVSNSLGISTVVVFSVVFVAVVDDDDVVELQKSTFTVV